MAQTELVEVELGTLTYLFDIACERVIGVYAASSPTNVPRPTARMRGHPSYTKAGEEQTDRGHLAAHVIGGGTDISLVPQADALIVDPVWRNFERYPQHNPGVFFVVPSSTPMPRSGRRIRLMRNARREWFSNP